MTETMGVIAASLQADAEALRVIAENISNADTAGYRRTIPLQRLDFSDVTAAVATDTLPQMLTATDVTPGALKSTGESFDLAIEGNGFFVVSTTQGEMLTRRGDLRLDAEGRLVTQGGDAILGVRGPITLEGLTPSISADGMVRAGDQIIDRLRLVEVEDVSDLVAGSDGTYALAPGKQAIESSAARVRQGFLETSNVQPTSELLQLMETMRRFETGQRFARGYDEMTDKAIATLGRI